MAEEYGVSRRTFYTMLKESNLNIPPGLITPSCQKKIYEEFGYPASEKPITQRE